MNPVKQPRLISSELHELSGAVINIYRQYGKYTATVSKGCFKKSLNYFTTAPALAKFYAIDGICLDLIK